MQVIQVYMQNALRNFNYIIYSEKSKEAIFIDPFNIDVTVPIAKSHNLDIKYLVNTHYHPDHNRDNSKLLATTRAKEIILDEGETLELAEGDYIKAIKTPGHVMDHTCFIVYSNHKAVSVITGDALFNAGVGNCKNGGNVDIHFESTTNILKELPDELIIYPSHDYLLTNLKFAHTVEPANNEVQQLLKKREKQNLDNEFIDTTIGMEKLINPFFRLDAPDIKERFTGLSSKDIFTAIRKLRDHF